MIPHRGDISVECKDSNKTRIGKNCWRWFEMKSPRVIATSYTQEDPLQRVNTCFKGWTYKIIFSSEEGQTNSISRCLP